MSLSLYAVVLTAMALADKRVIGTRWLAYSVVVEMVKTVLQVMGGSVPRWLSTMMANELNIMAFFAMYWGCGGLCNGSRCAAGWVQRCC